MAASIASLKYFFDVVFWEDSFFLVQLARICASPIINIEKILNIPITKFYSSHDVNVIAAELRL